VCTHTGVPEYVNSMKTRKKSTGNFVCLIDFNIDTGNIYIDHSHTYRYYIYTVYVVEDCSETDGVHSAGTKAKLSIYLSI
jgi:hypothetical protein